MLKSSENIGCFFSCLAAPAQRSASVPAYATCREKFDSRWWERDKLS